MSQRERNDAIFRAALTPPASRSLTAGLADAIHDSLVATPQETPSSRWQLGGRPFLAPARATVLVLVLLALLVLGAVVAVLSSRPVPHPFGVAMYRGGPERTGVMPGPGPVGDPILDWQLQMNGPVAVMPVVLDGTVYAADGNGTVQALDEATGKPGWTTELGSPVNGSPAIAGGRLLLGTDAGEVVALDLKTGSEVWRFKGDGPIRASPAIVGDVLYVGSDDGNVYALDLATGDRLWAHSLGAPVTRGVAISAGVVYAGATGGRFTALDAAAGIIRWSRDDLGAGEVGTPMVADGLVFVATGLLEVGPSDRVMALDIQDGRERWHFATPDHEPLYTGAVADGAIYVSSNNGEIYRLDEMTGSVAQGWPFHAGGPVGYMTGLVDGVIYASSGDHVIYAIDVATGRSRWQIELPGEPNVPAVIDGRIFVGTNLGKIVAIGGTKASGSQ